MFGYLIPYQKDLTKEQLGAYRARYCGLCRAIGARYGTTMRTALSYEMTFLALLLDHLSGTDVPPPPKCFKHPFRKQSKDDPESLPEHLAYAADLTVLLLIAKLRDDIADEDSRPARSLLRRLEQPETKAKEARPDQAAKIESSLAALSEMENANELRPDLPAGVFGDLVGNLFLYGEQAENKALYHFGFALGKLIYLMDATADLKKDLKHERYNPLVLTTAAFREEMLDVLSEDLLSAFEALPEGDLTPILQNILKVGIWTRFRTDSMKKMKKTKKTKPGKENTL